MSNERKENTVQASAWTKQPQFLRLFDDYAQYLDYLSVWYGDWSSLDLVHLELDDESDGICLIEGFLVKDRSRMMRRKNRQLHRSHVHTLYVSIKKSGLPAVEPYKRLRIIQPQCVEFVAEKISEEDTTINVTSDIRFSERFVSSPKLAKGRANTIRKQGRCLSGKKATTSHVSGVNTPASEPSFDRTENSSGYVPYVNHLAPERAKASFVPVKLKESQPQLVIARPIFVPSAVLFQH